MADASFCCSLADHFIRGAAVIVLTSVRPRHALALPARLAYEQSVNGALKKHLETVETAHSTRERDWHVLADKWKDYETKAIAENQR